LWGVGGCWGGREDPFGRAGITKRTGSGRGKREKGGQEGAGGRREGWERGRERKRAIGCLLQKDWNRKLLLKGSDVLLILLPRNTHSKVQVEQQL